MSDPAERSIVEDENMPDNVRIIYPASIIKAIHNVMNEIGYVKKGKFNKGQGFKYTSEGDLLEKLRPVILSNGLILIPSVMEVKTGSYETKNKTVMNTADILVDYTIAHVSGGIWPEKIRMAGSGADIGDKAVYKAITGANKYALFKIFQIATGDDPEKDSHERKDQSAPVQSTKNPPTDNSEPDSLFGEVEKSLRGEAIHGFDMFEVHWKANRDDWYRACSNEDERRAIAFLYEDIKSQFEKN